MLKVELRQSQVAAANQIRRQMPIWNTADEAFGILAERVPGFGPAETLLKVAAINQLYGTNVYAVNRMAAHITAVLSPSVPQPGPALVERIAALPPLDGQGSRQYVSFASKFCHFFLNQEACPIFDRYAVATIRLHLGRKRGVATKRRYLSFVNDSRTLLKLANVTATAVELDRYLWVRGAYEQWREKPAAPMNGELQGFFKAADESQIGALIGYT